MRRLYQVLLKNNRDHFQKKEVIRTSPPREALQLLIPCSCSLLLAFASPARVVGWIRKPCSRGWHFKQKHSSATTSTGRWCQLMGEHGLLYIPARAKSRRKKRKRARKRETQLRLQRISCSLFCPFTFSCDARGGGNDGNALLSGLQQLLSQHVKGTKQPHGEDSAHLLNDLKKLVQRPPGNLIEALQKIVTKHSQTATSSRSEASRWPCP